MKFFNLTASVFILVCWTIGCSGTDFKGSSDANRSSDEQTPEQDSKGDEGADESGDGGTEGLDESGGEIQCAKRKVLIYNLQPAGSSPFYEEFMRPVSEDLVEAGYQVSFENRSSTSDLSEVDLSKFDVLMLLSGCGGHTGLPSDKEILDIKNFYLGGGNLALVTDDNEGDSNAPGSCHDRVNPIATNFGIQFSGLENSGNPACRTVTSNIDLFDGLKMSRNTPASMKIDGPVLWGKTSATMVGTFTDGTKADALVQNEDGHGAALFSPDFGSLSCDGYEYTRRIIEHLGCK